MTFLPGLCKLTPLHHPGRDAVMKDQLGSSDGIQHSQF